MQFIPPACPQCGQPPKGTIERLLGLALLDVDEETGSAQYGGETELWWDSQKSVRDKQGRVTLVCANDHEWKAEMSE